MVLSMPFQQISAPKSFLADIANKALSEGVSGYMPLEMLRTRVPSQAVCALIETLACCMAVALGILRLCISPW